MKVTKKDIRESLRGRKGSIWVQEPEICGLRFSNGMPDNQIFYLQLMKETKRILCWFDDGYETKENCVDRIFDELKNKNLIKKWNEEWEKKINKNCKSIEEER